MSIPHVMNVTASNPAYTKVGVLPVEIVRPERSRGDALTDLIGHLLSVFLDAWVVMLLLPVFTPWHIGYLPTVAGVYTLRVLQSGWRTPLNYITRARGKR